MTTILPQRMTQITQVGITYKPVFTHSLQAQLSRSMLPPFCFPLCCLTSWQHRYKHHHRCPGTSHVNKTVHELQARWKHTESCSQMLHIAPSSHQCYPLIFLPTLLPVNLLLTPEAWISDPPFSGTSHTSAYIVAASKKTSQFPQNYHSDNTV